MKFVMAAIRPTRLAFLYVFALYWVVFICGSIIALAAGGPAGLTAWYIHIFEGPLVGSCVGDVCTFTDSGFDPHLQGWGPSAAAPFFYLTITLLLGYFEWRFQRTRRMLKGTQSG